jgi:hypothetical protein
MKYGSAKVCLSKIESFEKDLKKIDISKADLKRNGFYTKALEELEQLKEGVLDLEDVFLNPDNTLRNIMLLIHLDIQDCAKK